MIDVTSDSKGSGVAEPEAAQGGDEPCENGLRRGERVEGIEVELEPKQLADHGLGFPVERLGLDAPVRGCDPHLPPVDDPMQPAVPPKVRKVVAERAVALGRQLEVVGLRNAEERHAAQASRVRTESDPRRRGPTPDGRRPTRGLDRAYPSASHGGADSLGPEREPVRVPLARRANGCL